jgi:hypothetical protein
MQSSRYWRKILDAWTALAVVCALVLLPLAGGMARAAALAASDHAAILCLTGDNSAPQQPLDRQSGQDHGGCCILCVASVHAALPGTVSVSALDRPAMARSRHAPLTAPPAAAPRERLAGDPRAPPRIG